MNPILIQNLLQQALIEDIGHGDITTNAIFTETDQLEGKLIAKQAGTIAGLPIVQQLFQLLDPNIQCRFLIQEGTDVEIGTVIGTFRGTARAILSGERIALNLLQRMSGIATETRNITQSIADLSTKIVDTRKTLPGLRMLDKYAVQIGGGYNHRHGLYDAVMIKDNHIAGAGSMEQAVAKVREKIGHMVKIEIEVESLDQVKEALNLDVDVIMLDNMSPALLKQAVDLIHGQKITEASGGITAANVREYALTGVDTISIGWLTHSVQALDISLNIGRKAELF